MKLSTLLEAKVTVGDFVKKYDSGDLDLENKHLISLKGSPKIVTGMFNVNLNHLTTLEDGPEEAVIYSCSYTGIKSLKGAPKKCENFYCSENNLKDLDGLSLEGANRVNLSKNLLQSLKDVHKHIKSCIVLDVSGNRLKSHLLGVFLIKGLERFSSGIYEVDEIIDKYLPEGRAGLPKAQNELIEAGYEEFAQI